MATNTVANQRIAKNSILLSIRLVVVLCISLYTTRAVLSALGVIDYGVYNVVCGFVSMFTFLNTSLTNGIQRFYNFEMGKNGEEGVKRVYNTALLIQVLLALAVIVFAETFGTWYLENKMVIPDEKMSAARWIFQFSIIGFIFIIMNVPYSAAIMAYEKMDYFAFMGVLVAVLKLSIALALPLFSGDRLIIYGLLLLFIHILCFFLYFAYAKIKFPSIKIKRDKDKGLFKSILTFSGWNVVGSFALMMQTQGMNLVLNLFFGPVVNAARGIAAQVTAALLGFVGNVGTAIRPQIVQSYAIGDYRRTMNLSFVFSRLSTCLFFIISLPICLEINFVLNLWLGPDNVPDHTATFVFIVILISYISNLNSAVSYVVHASGQMKTFQIVTSIILLSVVPVAYFVLWAGATAEFALTISFFITCLNQFASLLVLKRIISYDLFDYLKEVIWPFIKVLVVSIPLPLLLHFVMDPGWMRTVIVFATSVACSAAATYFMALREDEKKLLGSYLLKIIKK